MKPLITLISFLSFLLILTASAHASWFSGGHIEYEHITGDTYRVELTIFRFCRGMNFDDSTVTVSAKSTCGSTMSLSLNRIDPFEAPSSGDDGPPQTCRRRETNCTVSNADQGYIKYRYADTVSLKPTCQQWNLSYKPPCCRNSTVNSIAGDSYIENTLISQNSSPKHIRNSLPVFCTAFPFSYNMILRDPDGDSLSYSFVSAKTDSNQLVQYASGLSGSSPLQNISIDPITGQINGSENQTGNFIVAILVQEYDQNGALKGEMIIDHQLRFEVCANTAPADSLGIQNYLGNGNVDYINNKVYGLQIGDTFSFDITIWDPEYVREDSLDTLLITSNVQNVLPNSSMSINPINDSMHVVTIAWRVVNTGSVSQSFFIETSDDACPIPGFVSSSYEIVIGSPEGYDESRPVFKVFPNPSKDKIHIQSNSNIQQVLLLDLAGKTLIRQDIRTNKCSIDVSDIATGVYLLKTDFSFYTASRLIQIR